MSFERPWLLVLLVLPVLAWLILNPPGRGQARMTYRLEIWMRAARELNLLRPHTSPYRFLPLLLALVCLALAVSGPEWGRVEGADSLLVVLDRSPSMAAKGKGRESRFALALRELSSLIKTMPGGVEVTLLGVGGKRVRRAGGMVTHASRWLAETTAWSVAAGGRADLPTTMAGLRPLGRHKLILTDLAGPEKELTTLAPGTTLRLVTSLPENGTLFDLELAPTWPAPLVQARALVNPGPNPRTLVVRSPGAKKILTRQPVPPGGRTTVELKWPRGQGLVEVALEPTDGYPLDDRLQLSPLPQPALRVNLRAAGQSPSPLAHSLAQALSAGAGRLVKEGEGADLVILEGGQLAGPLPTIGPHWLLLGTKMKGRTGEGTIAAPTVGVWQSEHPLLRGLDFSQLGITRALATDPTGVMGEVLVQSTAGDPLILARDGPSRVVHLLFAPGLSSLPAELLLPRFLHRCLAWFSRLDPDQGKLVKRPGGALIDPVESDLVPGKPPLSTPLPTFAKPGTPLAPRLFLASLALLALWFLIFPTSFLSRLLPFLRRDR